MKSNKILCHCAKCGAEVWKIPAELKKSKSGNVFCSKSCACSYNNEHLRRGDKNPNWKGGSYNNVAYLKLAYRTYAPKCAVCGETDLDMLEVHHIDGNRKNNDIDNLIILCANHHAKVHRGGMKITEAIKGNREIK